MDGVWVLRWLILAVTALLGVFLLARGRVAIGGVVLVLAGLRAAMFITMMRRRQAFRDRMRARRGY